MIHRGDCLAVLLTLPAESVQCVVTSPPYWGLRDYGTPGQMGLEATPDEYVANMVAVFREVRRVLRKDGTLWLNMGDSYATGTATPSKPSAANDVGYWNNADKIGRSRIDGRECGLKPKDLVGIPWRVAFALQADGWYLRSDIIWSKPNPMPESVTDRPTKSHEYLFLLSKSARYYYDAAAIQEPSVSRPQLRLTPVAAQPGGMARVAAGGHNPTTQSGAPTKRDKQAATGAAHIKGGDRWTGFNERWDTAEGANGTPMNRNRRTVWTVATQPYPEAHFATYPEALVEPCILAGSKAGDVVLDPFAGSGTTLAVAKRLGREGIGIELKPEYIALAEKRIAYAIHEPELFDG